MNTSDVIRYFGSQSAAAKALGITRSAISQWGDLVPLATAARLEKLTNNRLKIEIEAYARRSVPFFEDRAV